MPAPRHQPQAAAARGQAARCRRGSWPARVLNEVSQVEELVVAELQSCLLNLNNIESEAGFFHAYHMRALSIAGSLGPAAGARCRLPGTVSEDGARRQHPHPNYRGLGGAE